MRVALIHYWLLNMRGGEKVLEALCRLLPGADIFTLFYEPERVSPLLRSHRIIPSGLNPFRRFHRSLLPLMPLALEQFDLRDYDLVVSSESGPAKGVITRSSTRHVCYCHTPMRYLWDLYPDHALDWMPRWKRVAFVPLAHYLRLWDFASAARVDEFVANSANVQRRIQKTYRRDSRIVYPPVEVDAFRCKPSRDYFLAASELVPYKRLDYAVRCFARSGRQLKIVGDGPEYSRLRALASANVEFCGRVSDAQLRDLYAECRAFVQPGEEDFGIAAVEAVASGKGVVALARGGVLEIPPPEGAFLYDSPDESGLSAALARFDAAEQAIPVELLRASARRFAPAEFERGMRPILNLA
jgi:glycosyltransferase involved in cell wall biosynthesis